MKKLLSKLFPNFFNHTTCVHHEVNYETIKRDNALNVVIVDPDAELLFKALGIAPEHAEKLMKAAKKAYTENKDISKAIAKVSVENCNHINELIFCTLIMADRRADESNPFKGLQGMVIKGPFPPGFPPQE